MGDVSSRVRVRVWGCFDVSNSLGHSLLPPGEKSQAIIATLCSAENLKRSRKWLQAMFWADDEPRKAAANLRQAVRRLRQSQLYRDGVLRSDATALWLDSNRVEVLPRALANQVFLEGCDLGDEEFEEWLREQRSCFEDTSFSRRKCATAVPSNENVGQENHYSYTERWSRSETLPCIALYPVAAQTEIDRALGENLLDIISSTVLHNGCASIYDVRDGVAGKVNPGNGQPDTALVLRLIRKADSVAASINIQRVLDRKVLWSGWFPDIRSEKQAETIVAFQTVASQIANAVHDSVARYVVGTAADSLFSSVFNVLSHSRVGQSSARAVLRERAEYSGVARAWLMYTFAVAHAERHGGLDQPDLEELNEHAILAAQSEPNNPIVQAIVGHINAFVFRRMDRAEEHHAIARRVGWNHPMVWTLSAMHANYCCDAERAYTYSSRAMAQSESHLYRFVFAGPHSISCSLTGRHKTAISFGHRILERKPVFLAVMRHMAASQIMSGSTDAARITVEAIRERDPQYFSGSLSDPSYPLPSPKSIEMIEQALCSAGMGVSARFI